MKHPFLYLFLLVVLLSSFRANQEISIYCIGDSTMANKKAEVFPETGWCQVLGEYLDKNVSVHNHAVNGRSTKSFIGEGRWEVVLDSLKPGDYVFIQFGHNDQKDYDTTRYTTPFGSYTGNLKKFVTEARGKGAEPILFTSIVRRNFDENEKLIDTHGDYPTATRKVAKELKVPLIDLREISEKWVNSLGDEPSKKMYVWTDPDEKFQEGRKDDTHLSLDGAKMLARLALEECKKQKIPFTKYLKN
jgi:lysophospholipase L1-like esterase